jgi:hypothetical protein
MSSNWGDNFDGIQPDALKRQCAACGGRFHRIDRLGLCTSCRSEYDAESAAGELQDRTDDDRAAARASYGA